MKGLLIFGKTGQVARELAHLAPDAHFAGRDQADLADPAACAGLIRALRPRAVINAAAYTAVDKAEAEPEIAALINADAPGAMARACADPGIPFLHISSDYVFDGAGDQPRAEGAECAPLGVYGRSKLAGERAVAAAGGHHAILRTSWVFSAHGVNFVKTMRRLGAERGELAIVADQIGGPTGAGDIAQALLSMTDAMLADPARGGLYHFAGSPDTSWADFAREIFAQSGQSVRVTDIASSEYPTPARRPLNSRLSCAAISHDFGITRPHWRQSLARVIERLNA